MMPILPPPPPPGRYADPSTYGFYLEFTDTPKSIDQIVSSTFGLGEYVELNLNPQQISFEEPIATAISFTQGGGKFIESRGGIIKQVVVQGTTGFLPPSTSGGLAPASEATSSKYTGGLVDFTPSAEDSRAKRSGFAAFHNLRFLFRRFAHSRRLGENVVMHYMDFASDEFWIVEPSSFVLRQNARRKTLRDYEIRFACLEPSGASNSAALFLATKSKSVVSSALRDMPVPVDPRSTLGMPDASASVLQSFSSSTQSAGSVIGGVVGETTTQSSSMRAVISRFQTNIDDGYAALSFVSGQEESALRGVLDSMNDVVSVFDDAEGFIQDAATLPSILLRNVDNAITEAFDTLGAINTPEQLSDGVMAEWNEFLLETRVLVDHARASFSEDDRSSFANRTSSALRSFSEARGEGAASDVITETGRPLTTNPFIGLSGLQAIVDERSLFASDSFKSAAVLGGETIYDVARRCLGNVQRFVELVILNDLSFPFIVANASDKPAGTIAWGEFIKIPVAAQNDSEAAVGPNQPPNAVFGGTVSTTGTNQEVIDTHKETPWRENQWVGYTVEVTNGAAILDPVRLIVSNTADTLEVNRPWTTNPAVGDTFTISLREFTLRIPPTPEELAFGRDVLLIWNQKRGDRPNPFEADIVRNSRGDYATIAGFENYHQALMLLFATPKGEHLFHPRYGVGLPIGRPFNLGTAPLYNFFVRQSILDDPRTESVAKSLLKFEGGVYSYQAEVKPLNVHKAKQVNLVVGGG